MFSVLLKLLKIYSVAAVQFAKRDFWSLDSVGSSQASRFLIIQSQLQFWTARKTGWWFGTFFIFPYIGNNHPNWLIFFRGVQTTNQNWLDYPYSTEMLDYPCGAKM